MAVCYTVIRMRPALCSIILFAITAIAYAQPPAITQEGVRNAASRMPPSLPGGSLAPGALFTIQGLRLGGANSETHIHIQQQGSDVDAQLISASAERIEARVPRQAPPGDSQLVVTRDGQPSRPFAIRVAPAAFGIFGRNGKGRGPGEIFNDDAPGETVNSSAAPAHPGAVATLLGTGLGAETRAEVFVGGKLARVVSLGPRTGRPGVEEVRFQLAKDTPPGCYVPVLVKLPESVSNAVTMSVAPENEACSDAIGPTPLVVLARLFARAGFPVEVIEDVGAAIFPTEDRAATFLKGWELLPPTGTCTAYTGRWPTAFLAAGTTGDFPPLSSVPGRDAGPRIEVTGPQGTSILKPSPDAKGLYVGSLGGPLSLQLPEPPFLQPGKFRISGQGGQDIGAFATEVVYNVDLDWVGGKGVDTIDRKRGATVKWRGASAHDRVIVAALNVDQLSGDTGICLCVVPGSAGRWRLPALPLSNLPASHDAPGVPMSYVLMATLPAKTSRSFSAPGAQRGFAWFTALRARMVKYK
jgi:uncharacterized protein (TIGR03437 family)